MAITVVLQDRRIPGDIAPFDNDENPEKVWADAGTPLQDVVAQVQAVARGRKIGCLRIYGHGIVRSGGGAVSVSVGNPVPNGAIGIGTQLGTENIRQETLFWLFPLRSNFATAGRIELRSCMAGAGGTDPTAATYWWITTLAVLTGAYVWAAEENVVVGGAVDPLRKRQDWVLRSYYNDAEKKAQSLKTVSKVLVFSPFPGEPVKLVDGDTQPLTSGGPSGTPNSSGGG
jgi:hypothetical protein